MDVAVCLLDAPNASVLELVVRRAIQDHGAIELNCAAAIEADWLRRVEHAIQPRHSLSDATIFEIEPVQEFARDLATQFTQNPAQVWGLVARNSQGDVYFECDLGEGFATFVCEGNWPSLEEIQRLVGDRFALCDPYGEIDEAMFLIDALDEAESADAAVDLLTGARYRGEETRQDLLAVAAAAASLLDREGKVVGELIANRSAYDPTVRGDPALQQLARAVLKECESSLGAGWGDCLSRRVASIVRQCVQLAT